MVITVKRKGSESFLDIQVNREQKIKDTLLILSRAELLSGENTEHGFRIYSRRLRELVEGELTYVQAEIYNGDILELMEDGGDAVWKNF